MGIRLPRALRAGGEDPVNTWSVTMDAAVAEAPAVALPREDVHAAEPFRMSAVKFAMWLFLASEVMFFAGLLGSYLVLRFSHPDRFSEEALHLNWPLATFNTVVLIGSSLTMALAVSAAQAGQAPRTARFLGLTFVLGVVFLIVKAIEYGTKIQLGILPSTSLFYASYFTMTGCHALHLIGGLVPVTVVGLRALRGRVDGGKVELVGLYWHFVDLVWIFLFPLLYLI